MAKSVNRVTLLGTLGKDPELKYTPQGKAVCKFSIATNDSYKDKQSGEWKERTEWHNLVAWERTAEIAGEYLKKGGKVYIEGKLQTRSWDDKDSGQKKYMTEIVVNELVLIGGKTDSGTRHVSDEEVANVKKLAPREVLQSTEITDEDIPF